jgi:transcriptional regulator GlxA family with amidase domain
MKIGIVLFDGFTDLDFFLPWDLLNRPRLLNLEPEWSAEILGSRDSFTSAAGLRVHTSKPYDFANTCDGVLVTSGPRTRLLMKDQEFIAQFSLDPVRQVIGAIDSGSLLLGALGLLNGRRATTYPTAFDLLEELGALPIAQPFVVDGVATAARCLSGDQLALWMIEKLASKTTAAKVYESIKPLTELT